MIPIRLSAVLTAAAAENAAASDDTFDTFAAATAADAAWGTVEPTAADDACVRETVKPTAANYADGVMASTVALGATSATMASTTPSVLAATPLAVSLQLDRCCQSMATTGTSIPRPFILDPRQGFP